jgi:hypothetical protein
VWASINAIAELKYTAPTVRDALVEHRLGVMPLRLKPDQRRHNERAGMVGERRPLLPPHLFESHPHFPRDPIR